MQPIPLSEWGNTDNGMTPDQSAATLGHANSAMSNSIKQPIPLSQWDQPQQQQGQGQGQQTQAPPIGQPGQQAAQQGNTGGGMFSNLVNNIKKVPGQVMSLANKITAPGSGLNQAVNVGSDILAVDENIGKTITGQQSVDQMVKTGANLPSTNPLQDIQGGAEIAATLPGDVGAVEQTTKAAVTKASDLMASVAEKKVSQTAIKALTPKMTSGELEAAPNVMRPKIGAPRVDMTKDKGFMQIVNDTKGIVKGKSSIDDKNALKTAITKTAENLKSFFTKNQVPTNFANLIQKLKLVNPEASLKADPSAFKTYSRVREEVQASINSSMKEAAKTVGDFGSKTNPNDFWDAMKILDQKSEEELGTKVFGSPEYTGVKAAIQDMRQGLMQYARDSLKFPGQMEQVNKMQEFMQVARSRGIEINSQEQAVQLMKDMGITNTPEDVARSAFLEDSMSKMSNYYRAIDNVSTKIPDEIRGGATWAKRNPIKAGALNYGAKAVGAGALYEGSKKLGVPLP